MTSLMFQAMGIDPPVLPPTMPSSLREALYPQQQQQQQRLRQQQLLQQQQLIEQQKRLAAAYAASRQPAPTEKPSNPYSVSYSSSIRNQPRANSVYSPANMIRRPGTINDVTAGKVNPYNGPRQISYSNYHRNPYSTSRAGSSSLSSVRNKALLAARAAAAQAARSNPAFSTMKVMRDLRNQPKKIQDAQLAGCQVPGESAAATMLLLGNCKNPASQMVCQSQMMTCMDVGVQAMCCPFGMNRLAFDTITYVNKLQQYMAEVA